jgi:mRNA-degrading endonuclease YafQ of YafQ-DinJ toxin-antitoxin module
MLRIGYKPAFVRQWKKLPKALREEAKERIAVFCKNPREPSLHVHKLKGPLAGRWSFSVNYAYRIVFVYVDTHKQEALLLAIGDHDVYD